MIEERAKVAVIPSDCLPVPPDTTGDGGHHPSVTQRPRAPVPTPTTTNGSGHAAIDTHVATAGSSDVERASNGQTRIDPHNVGADLARSHALLGHYARQLWDIQAQRIAAGNRVAAMERDGLSDYAEPARAIVNEYATIEKAIDRELTKIVRQHFMAPWIAEQRGIGLPGFARILGVTGSLDRFATVSKLWKYLGLHVVDGHAPRREKGVPWTHTNCQGGHLLNCKSTCTTDHHPHCVPDGVGTAYAPQGRVICHQIAESIVKARAHKKPCPDDCAKEHLHRVGCQEGCTVQHGGPYGAAYDRKKAYYEAEREDWPQARRHNAAMRYAVKELLKEMWIEWQIRRPRSG